MADVAVFLRKKFFQFHKKRRVLPKPGNALLHVGERRCGTRLAPFLYLLVQDFHALDITVGIANHPDDNALGVLLGGTSLEVIGRGGVAVEE